MKKIFSLTLIIALILGLSACGSKEEEPFEKGEKLASVFVATDTHLLSNDLFSPDNQKYVKKAMTADGRVQEHDYLLMEALVEEVNREKPDALIITGDLTFYGEKTSHKSFVSFLDRIDKDVKLLVIPGNHDFNIDGCRSYFDDAPHGENTVSGPEFCKMYEDYGYSGALSYDGDSHSYIYEINDSLWAVMLDTTLCEYNYEAGLNSAGGAIWEETMEWLRPWLEKAREKGITVVGFSHHNLAVHNENFVDSYVMFDAVLLQELYEEYGVRLHFSGHMHNQNIAKAGSVYDIAQGALLDYGNRIGKLDVYDNCMEYSRTPIGGIQDYSFEVFCNKYMGKRQNLYQEKYGKYGEEVHILVSRINAYYFDGDYEKIHEILSERSKAVRLLKKNEKDTYIGTLLKVENKDQNYLLIK